MSEQALDNNNCIIQPHNLERTLYKHQLINVYKMEEMEREQKYINENEEKYFDFGINADSTGYGKTITMVALILRDKMQWNIQEPFIKTNYEVLYDSHIVKKSFKKYNRLNCTLVLCSNNIVKQWKEEFNYAKELNIGYVLKNKDILNVIPSEYDVIIVTPNFYNSLVSTYENYAWKRFIFDEAGSIAVQSMKEIISGFMWFISATPNSILEKHSSCNKSFMSKLFRYPPYYYYSNNDIMSTYENQIIKSSEEMLIQSFTMPQTQHIYYKCHEPLYRATLGLVNDNISEMIAAGDIKNVIEKLGGESTDNIIELIRNRKERDLTQFKYLLDNENFLIISKDKILENIHKIESQLKELDERLKDLLNGDCPICCDKLKEPMMETTCHNMFCTNCILTWLESNRTCPLCRNNICMSNLIHIKSETHEQEEKETFIKNELKLTKFEHISNILKEDNNSKILLFSCHNSTFGNIKNFMQNDNILFKELKGSIHSIENTISDFKNGKIKVLFLNSNYSGSGINFQECTDIIIFHDMSEDLKKQILGRANRIGRTIPLKVHYLF